MIASRSPARFAWPARGSRPARARRAAPIAASLAALVLHAGCATLPTPALPGTPGVSSWDGRFAVTLTPADGSAVQRSGGRFSLTTSSRASELELVSPLGATLAMARVDASGATLATADGKRWSAENAEALTEQALGWRVPVQRLPGWLRGEVARPLQTEPAPGGGSRLVHGVDGDWDVRIEQWGEQRPERMTVRWPAGDAPAEGSPGVRAIELRLAIDDATG